jgi:hypothetical protein
MRQKRKMVEAIVPARKREIGFGCPHVGNAVAEVGRRRLVPNTLGKRALKKSGQGRVNGDLARNVRRRVKPSASRSGEGTSAGRAHRIENGERIGRDPR